jgi:prepilin-type N-terminal cleavage/methylation domain-containing protein
MDGAGRFQISGAEASEDEARCGGFSLVELLVAVLVLSIAVIAGYRVLGAAVVSTEEADVRLVAGLVARNEAELLSMSVDDETPVDVGGRRWIVEIEERDTLGEFTEIEIFARPSDRSAGARLITYRPRGSDR